LSHFKHLYKSELNVIFLGMHLLDPLQKLRTDIVQVQNAPMSMYVEIHL